MNQGYFGKSKTIVFLFQFFTSCTDPKYIESRGIFTKLEFCVSNASQSIKTHGCELNL